MLDLYLFLGRKAMNTLPEGKAFDEGDVSVTVHHHCRADTMMFFV